MLGWLESGQDSNPLDAKIAALAFAEGIGQLAGGLPMGQNEIFRPADLGLGAAARLLDDDGSDLPDADHGAIRAAPAAALAAAQRRLGEARRSEEVVFACGYRGCAGSIKKN